MRGVSGGSVLDECIGFVGLVIGVDPEPRGREDVCECEGPRGRGDRTGVDMACDRAHASERGVNVGRKRNKATSGRGGRTKGHEIRGWG